MTATRHGIYCNVRLTLPPNFCETAASLWLNYELWNTSDNDMALWVLQIRVQSNQHTYSHPASVFQTMQLLKTFLVF